MSSSELHEWSMYFRIEPHNSTEVQLGYLSYILSSVNGGKNMKLEDFMITEYKEKKEDTNFTDEDSVKGIFSSIATIKQ
jgi:hypothetical protein